jgi:hypothetical protein
MSFRSRNALEHQTEFTAQEYNPFDEVEFLPGLGYAVLSVVLAYLFVYVLLLPGHAA